MTYKIEMPETFFSSDKPDGVDLGFFFAQIEYASACYSIRHANNTFQHVKIDSPADFSISQVNGKCYFITSDKRLYDYVAYEIGIMLGKNTLPNIYSRNVNHYNKDAWNYTAPQ